MRISYPYSLKRSRQDNLEEYMDADIKENTSNDSSIAEFLKEKWSGFKKFICCDETGRRTLSIANIKRNSNKCFDIKPKNEDESIKANKKRVLRTIQHGFEPLQVSAFRWGRQQKQDEVRREQIIEKAVERRKINDLKDQVQLKKDVKVKRIKLNDNEQQTIFYQKLQKDIELALDKLEQATEDELNRQSFSKQRSFFKGECKIISQIPLQNMDLTNLKSEKQQQLEKLTQTQTLNRQNEGQTNLTNQNTPTSDQESKQQSPVISKGQALPLSQNKISSNNPFMVIAPIKQVSLKDLIMKKSDTNNGYNFNSNFPNINVSFPQQLGVSNIQASQPTLSLQYSQNSKNNTENNPINHFFSAGIDTGINFNNNGSNKMQGQVNFQFQNNNQFSSSGTNHFSIQNTPQITTFKTPEQTNQTSSISSLINIKKKSGDTSSAAFGHIFTPNAGMPHNVSFISQNQQQQTISGRVGIVQAPKQMSFLAGLSNPQMAGKVPIQDLFKSSRDQNKVGQLFDCESNATKKTEKKYHSSNRNKKKPVRVSS